MRRCKQIVAKMSCKSLLDYRDASRLYVTQCLEGHMILALQSYTKYVNISQLPQKHIVQNKKIKAVEKSNCINFCTS